MGNGPKLPHQHLDPPVIVSDGQVMQIGNVPEEAAPRLGDAFGRILTRCWASGGRAGAALEVAERDDGYLSVTDAAHYFATPDSWPATERWACEAARGRVLDIGCGAGRHARHLSDTGLEVVGLEASPGAAEVARERGVSVVQGSLYDPPDSLCEGFDTLLLAETFGLLAGPQRAPSVLATAASLARPGALILGSSLDPYVTDRDDHVRYHAWNRKRDRYPGHVTLRVRDGYVATPFFDMLLVSADELAALVEPTPWRLESFDHDGPHCLACLTLPPRRAPARNRKAASGSPPQRAISPSAVQEPDLHYLFPKRYGESPFPSLCEEAFSALAELMPAGDLPRVPGWEGPAGYKRITDQYAQLADHPADSPSKLVRRMSADLLAGTTVWRSPELHYNIGAAANSVAAAMYAIALDVNVFLINDGQAGNAVLAEHAVSAIMADLAGIPDGQGHGLFTFGGTGTIAYAIKAGIRKAAPESVQRGVPDDIHIMITEDAHFSHIAAADWLGIGTDRLITAPAAGPEHRTDLAAAERSLRQCLDRGGRIAAIIINGGTTYDHTVDDIEGFAALRSRLTAQYQLDYRPHLHVDSVIGWGWLMLTQDITSEALGVPVSTMRLLARQHQRIQGIRHADSWGIDFHKGIGGCPVDCSFVMFNDKTDLGRLRKAGTGVGGLHQLAAEFSELSPADYTLETSRCGGKALAALAALHSMGRHGYQALLSRLVDAGRVLRGELSGQPELHVLNADTLGFNTMVRFVRNAGHIEDTADAVSAGNAYLKEFFAWDNATRMNPGGGGTVYSFSGGYRKTHDSVPVSALKFYPTSPHVTAEHMREAARLLMRRKAEFDEAHRQ